MNRILLNPIVSLESGLRVTFEKVVEYPKTTLAVTGLVAGSAVYYFYNCNRFESESDNEEPPKRKRSYSHTQVGYAS